MSMRRAESNGHSGMGGLEGLLEPGDAPSFLIDPIRSTLEAANAAARRIFRLTSADVLPRALDSAMPALIRLRQVLANARPAKSETLNFWVSGAMTTMPSALALIEAPDGRTLILVCGASAGSDGNRSKSKQAPAIDEPQPSATPDATAAANASTPASPPPRPRSDAETLREIARRIREGQPARQTPLAAAPILASPNSESAFHVAPLDRTPDTRDLDRPSTAQTEAAPNAQSLAQIAHELKTPLSAIVAASEIMRDQRLGAMGNERYLDYANDIHQSARHALDVVDAMLRRGAGDTGTAVISAVDKIARDAVSVMRPLAEAARVGLFVRSDKGRLEVLANATSVRQILFNLISNALKFTPTGGEIHVLSGFLDDGSVYLVVRDTGSGMDEAAIARAFFADSEEGTPRPGGGYGYGLPLVRRLAIDMGAALEVDSAPGKGTAILLSFPHAIG